jgi:hypothetical protein
VTAKQGVCSASAPAPSMSGKTKLSLRAWDAPHKRTTVVQVPTHAMAAEILARLCNPAMASRLPDFQGGVELCYASGVTLTEADPTQDGAEVWVLAAHNREAARAQLRQGAWGTTASSSSASAAPPALSSAGVWRPCRSPSPRAYLLPRCSLLNFLTVPAGRSARTPFTSSRNSHQRSHGHGGGCEGSAGQAGLRGRARDVLGAA